MPSQIKVSGMIGTRAGITIMSTSIWPSSWPTTPVGSSHAGIGETTQSCLSSNSVLIKNPEGQTAAIQPYCCTTEPVGEGCFVCMGNPGGDGFLTGATALEGVKHPTLALKWLTTQPVWLNPSTGTTGSGTLHLPGFIKKKSGKWKLLYDLRKINSIMESMDALQPGMPCPTMIPASWDILIVDLKDCFFTIPLHTDDTPKFAFTVPSINNCTSATLSMVCSPAGHEKESYDLSLVCGTGTPICKTAIPRGILLSLHG